MKNNFIFFLVLFICFSLPVLSQTSKLDSLENALDNAKEDTNKVNILTALCWENRSASPETAINYGERALALATKLNFISGKAKAYNNLGVVYYNQGELDKAKENYFRSLMNYRKSDNQKKIGQELCNIANVYQMQGDYVKAFSYYMQSIQAAKKCDDMQRIAISLGNIGILYYEHGQYAKALEYYFKSLKIREDMGDKQGMSYALSNIGMIYDEMKDYDKALEFYFRSLRIREELKDDPGIATSLINIGMVYFACKNYDKAMSNFERALQISEKSNFSKGKAASLNNIGDVYKKEKKYEKALEYYFKSKKTYDESGNKSGVSVALSSIGEVYKEQKNYSTALENLNQSLNIAEEFGDTEMMKNDFLLLSEVYSKTNDFKNAYECSRQYAVIKDRLYSNENISQIADLQTKYETERREKEIMLLTKDKENQQLKLDQKNTLIWSFVLLFALIGALTIVIFNAYRNKRAANKLLTVQKEEIASEKKKSDELLLNILPHETAEELKATGKASVRYYEKATVMFTDFKGFTEITEKISPQKLIEELDICFKKFDHIIGKYPIEKIKTIGDSYMCAGGIPIANDRNPVDMVMAALEFCNYIDEINKEREIKNEFLWELRVGIHTGPVISGVVGEKKFAYDIWGDTVNTASRLETGGEPGKVNISETTYQLIKDKFKCTHRGKISTKGKGDIDMYFVEGIKS